MIMLLIACSAITTISADPTAAAPQKKPEFVIASLNYVVSKFGQNEGQVYYVNRNPNTGIIESSTKIVPFHCPADAQQQDDLMKSFASSFQKDEPLSYQFLHIQPGSNENFELKVITNNGQTQGRQRIRTNKDQEMWLMCCKNPENPQLRDAYAVVWELTDEMHGTVYMITSLRPDIFEKNMTGAGLLSDNKNTFTIDGRVGYDLKDSLYVVYMADNAEELNNVKDSDFVATMPVVNKRFSFSVELDKPKVGRIRTVMPDGSLCELWTNLDFVPGETYRITTHNGYYDEDRDFEQRVGRYSGKSLLNDLQRRGIDDQMLVLTDEVPEEFVKVADDVPEDQWVQAAPLTSPVPDDFRDAWFKTLTPQQKAEMILKGQDIKVGIERIKSSYTPLGEIMQGGDMSLALANSKAVDQVFESVMESNKNLDKTFQEFKKALFALNPPAALRQSFYSDAYKEILNVFTEQNKGFTEIFTKTGKLSKKAQKTQKYINKLTEKYMSEMMKSLR